MNLVNLSYLLKTIILIDGGLQCTYKKAVYGVMLKNI